MKIRNSGVPAPGPPRLLASLLAVAVWFGVVTGIVEGLGLLAFQRINWQQWARMMHVSAPILYLSPLVDITLFLGIALLIWAGTALVPRIPAIRVLVFVLVLLTGFDWLQVTGRLYRLACVLLALGVAVAFSRWVAKHENSAVRFWRKSAPWFTAAFVVILIGITVGGRIEERRITGQLPQASAGAPNVIVIVVDTLRADHLSSYGYPRATSPAIDALAKRGVLFENAMAPSSWSLPSHASLLTGRPVHEHGMGNVEPMPWAGWGNKALNGYQTLGEALQHRGYRTGAFSANRIYFTSNVGLGRGFIHFEDYFHSVGDDVVRTQFGRELSRWYLNRSEKSKITRALRHLGLDELLDKDSEGSGDYGGIWGIRKRAHVVNDETLRWIDRDRTHPFFAFLNYLDVHYAYGGPRNYPKPAWDHGATIDEYDAGIKYVDDNIGQLVHELEQRGLAKKTILVITSDHGESLGDHGLSYHGASLYRELIHVPLVMVYPGHLPQGMRIAPPVANASIGSTILQLAGDLSESFPGHRLSGLWQADSKQQPVSIISELPQTDTIVPQDRKMHGKIPIATDGNMASVVTERWHLITHEKDGAQIYEWPVDLPEQHNLIDTPEGTAAARVLKPR